jgi:hypothetical protein
MGEGPFSLGHSNDREIDMVALERVPELSTARVNTPH